MSDAALSVSSALALAKRALEQIRLTVVGEVSGLADKQGYKAVYFSLKDESAVLPCLMWRDAYDRSGIGLADGQLVEVTGTFSAYPARGQLQFQVRSIVIAGEGALRVKVAALARALEAEGLMDVARKRPIPLFPQRIGLVTSPRGKAVHDVIRTLGRRYPLAELVVAGVRVEGDGAVEALVEGLRAVGAAPAVDVVILGRGGGSYEDLMPFQSEALARAIVACPVAVVTGIGHEPDTCIADMVADLRASTPTAAAEAVAPDSAEVERRLHSQGRLLARALSNVEHTARHRLAAVAARPVLCDPMAVLGPHYLRLDGAAGTLARVIPERIARDREALDRHRDALGRSGARLLDHPGERVGRAARAVRDVGPRLLVPYERGIAHAAERLEDLSPLAILGRGYAVCYRPDGSVVRASREITPGERVDVRLAHGRLGCAVETIEVEE